MNENASLSWIAVELCFSRSWADCGDLTYARLLAVPRVGEMVDLSNRHSSSSHRVAEVPHIPATPGGSGPRIRVRLEASGTEQAVITANKTATAAPI
jgi:hypothetical protein